MLPFSKTLITVGDRPQETVGKEEKMGGNRKRAESEETLAEIENPKKRKILPSLIKNKEKRSAVHAKLKHEKKVEKKKKAKLRDVALKKALELGEEAMISLTCSLPLFLL